ncbi:putative general porin [Acinetobacter calcoaceticus]|uniref:Putative general porin n=1 Tax=Acinetobacter calcoaceticus TaxID=471 RepID=A0A4R1X8S4_ACICA|nr:putative general porin [Acinetobacter calcoaceticus]
MKKLGLATALLLAVSGAQAYQFEVQGQTEYLDTTQNGKNFTGAVQGTYYLKNVDSSKGPLAEAAFLNQASNVSVAYSYLDYDENKGADLESHNYGIKAEGYVPTKFVPVYASASYNHTLTKHSKGGEDNGDRYSLEVGALVAPNFLVAAGYTSVPNQFSLDTFGITKNGIAASTLETVGAIRNKTDAATLRAKYVGPISGTDMSFGFETAGVFGDINLYGANADLYLNNQLSVGGTFIATDGNSKVQGEHLGRFDQAWGANVNYFVTPAVAVGLTYMHANNKKADYDTDTVGLNAKYRF